MSADRPRASLTPAQLAEVKRLATAERRSVGNMLAVLVGEALAARMCPPVDPAPLEKFGGRRRGQACSCGEGTLEATRHEGTALAGWTIDCTACAAGYDEAGRHYCPVCEQYRDDWSGGTDADPRPWCNKCGTPQPGGKATNAR